MIRVPSQGRRAPKARALTRVPNRRDIFLVIQVEKIGPKRQSDNHCAASLPVNLRDKGEAWGHRSATLKHEPTNQSAKHHPEIENVAQSSLAVAFSLRLMHFVQMVLNFDKMSRQINYDLQDADGV